MPIFLDRHDIPGVSAQAVAEAHQQDLRLQHEYNCKGLTYWFDEEKGMAFCLIEAPNIESVRNLHNDAHGLIPNQIIQVDPNIVESFLGRIEDPADQQNSNMPVINDPAFRSIVIIYTDELFPIHPLDDESNNHLTQAFKGKLRKELDSHNGLEVEHTLEYFMVSFASIHQSIMFALEIQSYSSTTNSTLRDGIRMGISAGDPVAEDNALFGQTVKIAKRMGWIALPGQIILASSVSDHYKSISSDAKASHKSVLTLTPPEEEFINKVMDIMESNACDTDFDVQAFGHLMGMSKSKLYRNLTSITGYSPIDFIKEYRLRLAQKLIRKQQGNISEIAYESGFNSLSYFSKCFQQRFHILPSDYTNYVTQ